MEKNEVSRHEVAVYRTLAENRDDWMTSAEIASASGVAPRTARAHALKLVRLGLLDQAEVFPAHRYRLSEYASKRNRGYADRIARAADAFGIELPAPPGSGAGRGKAGKIDEGPRSSDRGPSPSYRHRPAPAATCDFPVSWGAKRGRRAPVTDTLAVVPSGGALNPDDPRHLYDQLAQILRERIWAGS